MERIRNRFLQCSMDPHEGNEHPHEGNEQLRLTPTEGNEHPHEGNEQMPIDNLVLNTICTTTEGDRLMENITKEIRK
jgi:hypothetical protein